MLLLFAAATVLLIPLEWFVAGGVAWLASLALAWRDPEPRVGRRMAVLLGCLVVLSLAPINTSTEPIHFLTLGLPFLAVVLVPALILRRTDPRVISYRIIPQKFRWLDIFYVIISIPLSYFILKGYFHVSSHMPFQWPLPSTPDDDAMTWLFWGINGVGVWDELFFVNTVYAVLRSLFVFRVANATQAVVYTSVLYHMAFTGIGPFVVYFFAWTQGSMFEESENLLYVLAVHLIVDFFLYHAILQGHYPGYVTRGIIH
jgi:hypothetical protein